MKEKLGNDEKARLFEQIVRSKREWQATFDSITDGIHICNENATILKANRKFAEFFGLEPRDVIGKKCSDLTVDSPVSPGCVYRSIEKDDPPSSEDVYDSWTGKTFRVMTFPYCSSEGEFMGSVHISRDITEEREKEIRLIMSERLASLGQMASGIAHEINNPLASIAGCTEGLLKRLRKDKFDKDIFKRYLEIIEEEIERCKKITAGMLSFVKKGSSERSEVNVNRILDKSLEVIGFQDRMRGIAILKHYSEDMPVIHGNEAELRQVFMTIVINALDAMNNNDRLTLSTSADETGVIIRINDTGSGIEPGDIPRIFTPFFTRKSDKGGVGLGLAIARKIITDHNGLISVESDNENGTTFQVRIPF